MHQRRNPARDTQALRLPGLCPALHARTSARRDDGVFGRGLRRLLPLPPARAGAHGMTGGSAFRSEEHTSELQSLMRISYAVFCLKKKTTRKTTTLEEAEYTTQQL